MSRSPLPLVLLLAAAAPALPACKYDLCADVTCPAMQRCDLISGICVGQCSGVACPTGFTCVEATGSCTRMTAPPPAPVLGALIDRAGRPLTSSLLVNAFDLYPSMAPEDGGVTKDRYNADAEVAMWPQRYKGNIAFHLGYLDALDGTCGNNLLASPDDPRYELLATMLADDRLYLNATAETCMGNYMAVERGVVADCGGRQLITDVVDISYSLLTSGNLVGTEDGVKTRRNLSTSFPFLGGPVE